MMDYNQSFVTLDATDTGDSAAGSLPEKNFHISNLSSEKLNRNHLQYIKCPPSLVGQMRERQVVSSGSCSLQDSHTGEEERSNVCMQSTFGLSSTNSIVQQFANPCHPGIANVKSESEDDDSCWTARNFKSSSSLSQTTPPTSGSSSESDEDSESNEQQTTYPVIRTSTVGRGKRKSGFIKGGVKMLVSLHVLIGDEVYLLTSTSTGYSAKRLKNPNHMRCDDKNAMLDLSCHSPLEWKLVKDFLNSRQDSRERIGWQKLPTLLPWFVELRSLPLISEVDTFLLYNVLGGRSDGTSRPISLANLLKLSKIAFSCGLETTKMQMRRFLRQGLQHPRKKSRSMSCQPVAEELELDWSLSDLRTLADLMASFAECREYLWEDAIIIYLPHDLDISNSMGLVSNPLFPYLLREGMMQMMIVESMEESSFSESMHLSRRSDKSFSDTSTASDTTVPTAPSKNLSEKEIERHLLRVIHNLEKFQTEKDSISTDYGSVDSSTIVRDQHKVQTQKIQVKRSQLLNQERFAC
jgi:hypothetical protein